MKTTAFILASVLAIIPCSGAMAAGTDGNTVTDIPSVREDTALKQEKDAGELVGICYNGEQLYENELINMIRNEDGDVKIQMMQYGLSIPASALNQAQEQGKKLIIEIFQPGNDAAMFNSRWVYDPATVYWTPDLESYPLGVAVDPNAPYHSAHPDAASNPISGLIRSVSEDEPMEWAVYSIPTADNEDGQTGYAIPGFYVEVAQWGEFDGMNEMPVYSYDEESRRLFSEGYAVRGDDAVVSDSIVWHTVRINNPMWGMDYAVLSDEHNFLPVEEIEAQIEDDSVPAVDVKMGSCFLDNQYVVPAGMLEKLKVSGKTLSLTSPGVESQPTYSWHFDGAQIKDTTDIDLHIRFYDSADEGVPVTIPQGISATLLDFTHSGPVPGGTSVSMTAGEEMQNGYLYHINEENGTFEYTGRTSWERENEFFGTLIISGITHCSYYLVTDQELTGDNVVVPEEPEAPVDPEEPETPVDPEDSETPVDPEETYDTDDKQPVDTEQTQDQEENKLQEDKSPQNVEAVKTGDVVSVLPVAAAAFFSLVIVVIVLLKKSYSIKDLDNCLNSENI